jgi:hypothetical protein
MIPRDYIEWRAHQKLARRDPIHVRTTPSCPANSDGFGENAIFMIHYSVVVSYEDSKMPTPHSPSAGVRRALRKLGGDIRDARRRHRLTMAVIAERAFTSRATLQRVEAGDSSVSIGIYAAVLQALGLLDGLLEIADAARDTVGQSLATAALPQRVRLPRGGAGKGDRG